MVHLRLIVPTDLVTGVVERLRAAPGVAHLAHLATASATHQATSCCL